MTKLLWSIVIVSVSFWTTEVRGAEGASEEYVVFLAELSSFHWSKPERGIVLPNGELRVTNSCGDIEVSLDVAASSSALDSPVHIKRGLNEWCDNPFPLKEKTWLIVWSVTCSPSSPRS